MKFTRNFKKLNVLKIVNEDNMCNVKLWSSHIHSKGNLEITFGQEQQRTMCI